MGKQRETLERMYRTLLFYAGTGFDSAICTSEEGEEEVLRFYNDTDCEEEEVLLAFYQSLLDAKGFRHTQRIFSKTKIEERWPILTGHLILSVYS
jgi:hypothetical protein